MTDPYKELGVSYDATDDEIKTAYRELVKKYHPDNYANDAELKDIAEEKMKTVNAAYDEIQKLRRSGSGSGKSENDGERQSTRSGYGFGTSQYTAEYIRVREMINSGDLVVASVLLDSIPEGSRGAEWNFLMGALMTRRGFYYDAIRYLQAACYLDPNNPEYREALNTMRRRGIINDETRAGSETIGCDPLTLCCLGDCLCGLCGNRFCHFC